MTAIKLRTAAEAKKWLRDQGITAKDWAIRNKKNVHTTYLVLNEFNKATRGEGYEIAVLLGMRQPPQST